MNNPWTRQIRTRQHYFALYSQNKIPKEFYTHFTGVTGQIRQSKKDYNEHKFNAAKSNMKQTWRIIMKEHHQHNKS